MAVILYWKYPGHPHQGEVYLDTNKERLPYLLVPCLLAVLACCICLLCLLAGLMGRLLAGNSTRIKA